MFHSLPFASSPPWKEGEDVSSDRIPLKPAGKIKHIFVSAKGSKQGTPSRYPVGRLSCKGAQTGRKKTRRTATPVWAPVQIHHQHWHCRRALGDPRARRGGRQRRRALEGPKVEGAVAKVRGSQAQPFDQVLGSFFSIAS